MSAVVAPVGVDPTSDWLNRSACLGVPVSVFFPTVGTNARRARAICALCPVQGECLEDALQQDARETAAQRHPDGIRGGKSPREREAIGQQRRKALA